jgi:hypothetical protein
MKRQAQDLRDKTARTVGLTSAERKENFDLADDIDKKALSVRERPVYGADSPHSYFLDFMASRGRVPDRLAQERIQHQLAAEQQQRAISTTTLGAIDPVLPLWTAEAIIGAVHNAAATYAALTKVPLPEQGTVVEWSKYSAGASAQVQATENSALTEGGGSTPAISFDSEPFSTVASYLDISYQAIDRSGGYLDQQIALDLGFGYGSLVEGELHTGSGSGGHIRGLANAAPTTSVAASSQTAASELSAVWNCYQQTAVALGGVKPDLLIVHPRRSAWWYQSVVGAPAPWVPGGVQLVESAAAATNLGGGTEDRPHFLRADRVPLATDGPTFEYHPQGAGTSLTGRFVIHGYLAFATAARPEAMGRITGLTTPAFP